MNQIYAEFLSYLRIVWRNRWVVLVSAWFLCVIGWIVVATIPDRFQSSARVYIDTDSMLKPLMQGITVDMDVFQRVDLVQRTLFSRPNLEKVVLMTDLDLTVETAEDKEALLVNIAEHASLRQQGVNLFQVGFENEDPELARKVVQSMLSIFVETSLFDNRTDMVDTQTFIRQQVEDYERQLVEAEARLADFKIKNVNVLPGSGDYYSNLEEARSRFATVQNQLEEAITVRDLLRSQLAAIPEFHESETAPAFAGGGPLASVGPPSNLELRINQLESEIDELLRRYTEQHPDVITARRLLDNLRAEKDAEDVAMAERLAEYAQNQTAATATRTSVANPVYQQLQVQLVNQESTIATLQKRLTIEQQAVRVWEERANTVPYVEAQLKELNRDYELIRSKYNEMRERQETARIAEEIETKTNKVQFRIVEPPEVPIAPIGPDRPLFLSGVFVASIGAGTMLSLLVGMLKGSFPDTMKLRSAFPMPILGSVSAVLSVADRRRHVFTMAAFTVVAMGLASTFGSLMMVETLGGALAQQAMQVADALNVTFVFDLLKSIVQRLNIT